MNIILMGPAGAGKGTIAFKLKEEYGIPHISTGDLFREISSSNTPLAIEVRNYIDKGMLVPDQITIKMILNRLDEADCKEGFILDGFPRNLNQAIKLQEELTHVHKTIDKAILLDVKYDVLLKRITGRRTCENCKKVYNIYTMPSSKEDICEDCGGKLVIRKDDNVEAFNVRYQTYLDQTSEAVDYYKSLGILVNIDGEGSIDDVYSRLMSVLKGE